MKTRFIFLLSLVLLASPISLLTSCTSASRKPQAASAAVVAVNDKPKAPAKAEDAELDEYGTAVAYDPGESVNRGIFRFNDRVYAIVVRPVAKAYETVLPKPVRKGLDNFFENVRLPVRLVNNMLQGRFVYARYELEKFLINSTIGVGGIIKQSNRFPYLAEMPIADTAQTFAKWRIGKGPYIVLPLIGPSTVREAVGYVGDSALNPVSWITTAFGAPTWAIAIPSTNTLRALPHQIRTYDAATKDTVDPYVAARTAYIQYRDEVARK